MGCFLGCFSCFDGGNKEQRKEQDRLASDEARAKAAEAAQKRQEQFEQSAAGRAARAQVQAAAKQSASSNKGEPVLKK
ncbi:transmembrane protein [Gossypium australe]|uniref:Transmembrane protein n=1 Tax=Gossypium australe TaxID=47621 RepID=A0A5B6X6E4_9ROSI|nr:transmembrane protein [Gossypium australe]